MTMCRHLDHPDLSIDDFIWHEEVARLHAEDKRIYMAAAIELHPWL